MGRKVGKPGKQRAQAAPPPRAQFADRHQLALWWWKVVVNSWQVEVAYREEPEMTMRVLELGLRVDENGEYALGTRVPRLGREVAPWDGYPELEIVRRQGLTRQPFRFEDELPREVQPWPRPPLGFYGALTRQLPHAGVDLRIKAISGRLDVRIHLFSVVGHELWDMDLDLQWSGVSAEQEQVEAARRAAAAEALRRHEEEDDFYEAFDPLYF